MTAGEVMIGERIVTDLPPKDRDIAMVFQNYALYPHMTVQQNLGIRPEAAPRARATSATGASPRSPASSSSNRCSQRKPAQLSGGQRQRVAMGRAIVREPQAFLMDEPLSNLDAKLRVQMRAELAHLRDRLETTTLYVTHDQVEAMTLGNRVAVMNNGVHPAARQAAEPLPSPRQPLRGGLHGLALDEPDRGRDRGRAASRSPDSRCRVPETCDLAAYRGRDDRDRHPAVRLLRRRRSVATSRGRRST